MTIRTLGILLLAATMATSGEPEGPAAKKKPGEEKPPAREPAEAKGPATKPPAEKPPAEKPPATKPPATVTLPPAGEHRAAVLLRLAGELYGRPVRVDHKGLNDVRIVISPLLGRGPATLETVEILLRGHGLHLHLWEHPKAGEIVVASARPDWKPPATEYKRTLTIRGGSVQFERTWRWVKEKVKDYNRRRPAGARRMVVVPAKRVGKIFLWAPDRKGLEAVEKVVSRWQKEEEESRPRLATYAARYCKAETLIEPLLSRLTAAEKKRVRIAVAGVGNRLAYRADGELALKVEGLLKRLDRPRRGR